MFMLLPAHVSWLSHHPALWMFVVTFGERLGFPIFISPLLLAAGAIVAMSPMRFWMILCATALPCLLGDAMWYELGRWKGRSVIRALCRISFVPDALEQKACTGLDRYHGVSLLWAKWVPGVAHLAPPVAGAARIPRLRFHLYNSLGSVIWIVVMLAAGVLSVRTFDWMRLFLHSAKWSLGLIAAGSIAMAIFGWWRRRQSRSASAA
jgi:membrane protein DedA with SNARE-associated domain